MKYPLKLVNAKTMPLNSIGTQKKRDVLSSIMEDAVVAITDLKVKMPVCHAVKRNRNPNRNQSPKLNKEPHWNLSLIHIIPKNNNHPKYNHLENNPDNQIHEESVTNQKMLETVIIGNIDTVMMRNQRDVKRLLMADAMVMKTISEQNRNVKVNVSVLVLCNQATEVEDVMTTSPDGISTKGIINVMNSNSVDAMVTKTISSLKTNVHNSALMIILST